MRRVEVSGLSGDGGAVELTVTLDVACHAVDEVGHGDASISVVSVSVDNRGIVNDAAGGERPHALIPMDMTREGVSIWISKVNFCKLTQQGMHQHHVQA
jgi:hypothetical protein